ncbi:MAG: extracellular solute-binding protein [Streptosporangiales bacterium]
MRTRRTFLKQALLASGGLAAAPVLGACGRESGALVFCSYGGSYQKAQSKAWIKPFLEANSKIRVVQDSPTDYAKLAAMQKTENVTWDLVDTGSDYGLGRTARNLEKLDCERIGCDELQPKRLLSTGFRVPVITYSVVVAYRKDKFGGRKPRSFDDFFNMKDFPGPRGVASQANNGSTLEIALIADGVPPDKLYPLDIDRALAKLDSIKSSLVYWETGEQSAQLLANGQVTMGTSWNGRVYTYEQEGAPVQIMWDQHFLTADYLVIPQGSRNVDAATKLCAYMVSAENNARISQYIAYGPSNTNALDKVPAKMRPYLPTSHLSTALSLNDRWWAENIRHAEEKFQAWRSA